MLATSAMSQYFGGYNSLWPGHSIIGNRSGPTLAGNDLLPMTWTNADFSSMGFCDIHLSVHATNLWNDSTLF